MLFGLIQWIASRSTRGSSAASLPFGQSCKLKCAPTTSQRIDVSTIRKAHYQSPPRLVSFAVWRGLNRCSQGFCNLAGDVVLNPDLVLEWSSGTRLKTP